jgi:NAD/NADP transhydrogenase beta subunit
MKPLIAKIKPASGFSRVVYVVFNVLLPLVVFALVRTDFVQLALAIILLSKWRMFAVRPRFWPANIRANAVDIIVGVSLLLFMVHTDSQLVQLLLTALYIGWLVVLKPSSTPMMVSLQALVSMLFGLMAIFVGWGDGPLYGLVLATGLVCYLAALICPFAPRSL